MIDFFSSIIKGKTIYRLHFHQALREISPLVSGNVLDLGAGSNPTHHQYLSPDCTFTKTDFPARPGVDAVVDFTQILPWPEASFDAVCVFNALYIAPHPENVLREIHRILKPGGICVISMPFVANEMPEPHDYHRFTLEGLDLLSSETGFEKITAVRLGDRWSSIAYILTPLLFVWPLRLIVYSMALFADRYLIPRKLRANYPFPLGYVQVSRKR